MIKGSGAANCAKSALTACTTDAGCTGGNKCGGYVERVSAASTYANL